jgi:Protein of unknown function (DUF3710)
MALRRREKRTEQSKLDATPPWDARQREAPPPTEGPYDVRDQPTDEVARIDLGALRVPVSPDLELRLDMNEAQQVIAATYVNPDGEMQLGIFAAPRNEGIWDSVRSEIRESVHEQGGVAEDFGDGLIGTELIGSLPGEGGQGVVPVRFIGVDGPRWFLRAMLRGVIAADSDKAAPFEGVLRDVVVVRGPEPLPVREPVALQLPKQALDALGDATNAANADPDGDTPSPPSA